MFYRFRSSIYIDSIIDQTNLTIEEARANIEDEVEAYASVIPNSFVGGTALFTPSNLVKPFDKDI